MQRMFESERKDKAVQDNDNKNATLNRTNQKAEIITTHYTLIDANKNCIRQYETVCYKFSEHTAFPNLKEKIFHSEDDIYLK